MTHGGEDTTDLRAGAPLHDGLLALLPLVGTWQGTGRGLVASTGTEFSFGQRVTFAHDGRPFLAYESRSWLVDDDGTVVRSALRETGFWRPGAGIDDLEVQLVNAAGIAESFTGAAGHLRWEIATRALTRTPTARDVAGERRLYALVDEALVYATELAVTPNEYAPHLNATLRRA